jgi:Rps23 Pro-64 3,4-dihydroxylase Tpa1-like proline 4-hydroxylase
MSENDKILDNIQTRISIENNPFPFFFTNNFLPLDIAKKAEDEFVKFSNLKDAGNERYQKTKLVFNRLNDMPNTIKKIIYILYSDKFLKILENKFNLSNLEPDWDLIGGGMHQSFNGGFLKVHSDFIYKRKSKQKRVINLLLYLNSNWKKEWNGSIELWDNDVKNKKFSVSPLLNNVVAFRTDLDSNHGFPDPVKCPEHESRKSIALYYYVKERSILPFTIKKRKYFHAIWKSRPSINEPNFSDQDSFLKRLKNKFFFRLF